MELTGNAASYEVAITGYDAGVGVLSVSDMIVDTRWSPSGQAPDTAQLVSEPTAALCLVGGLAPLLLARRRRPQV
jgi:hypothetical protein